MDYSRPPPPQPGTRTFIGRMGSRNLRPVVIVVASISALWSLVAAVGNLKAIGGDDHLLTTFSIALGAVYLAVALMELFGVFAAATQRLPFIRIYSLLTVLIGLLVVAAGLTSTIVHFLFKSRLISGCTESLDGATVRWRYGWFGPTTHETLDADDAADWCNNAWSRGSYSEIFSLLFYILASIFFSTIAFAYYRQALDPLNPANTWRAPLNQARGEQYPAHYSPYNPGMPGYSVPNLGYNGASQYAPPPGAPPSQYAPPPGAPPAGYDAGAKPPGYSGNPDFGYSGDKNDNPFDDFENGPTRNMNEEHDVTSRPAPGGQDRFL